MQTEGVGFGGFRAMLSDVRPDIERLSSAGSSGGESPQHSQLGPAEAPQSDGALSRFGIIAAVVAAIVIWIWVANSGSGTTSSYDVASADQAATTATEAAANAQDAAAAEAAAASPPVLVPASVYESPPSPIFGQTLNANEIAYCLAQEVRLQAAQTIISSRNSTQVDDYNVKVDDYNARCGNYRYQTSDRILAQGYVDGIRGDLEQQGRSWVTPASAPEPLDPIAPSVEPTTAGSPY